MFDKFTHENICIEIESLLNGPIMPNTVGVLANLMYIKKHLMEVQEEAADGITPLTLKTASDWVSHMENADGTMGPHWTMEKTAEIRKQYDVECGPLDFYVALNMIYSDYVKAAEKINANNMNFYVCMAQAFLDDKDAKPDKLARYYRYVVAH